MGWRSGEARTDDGALPLAVPPNMPERDLSAPMDPEGRGFESVATAEARTARRKRPEPTPAQRALGLLVRREHSQRELARKLTTRGVTADDAKAAVDKLKAAGWQDDGRFAENLVRSRAAAGFGPVRIRAELAMHGLDRELIGAALEGFEGDWNDLARDLIRRRFGPTAMEDRLQQRKGAELLLRRGFSGDQIRAATRYDAED